MDTTRPYSETKREKAELVHQLKQRKADGETNLIIVQDKIVVRRQRP